MKTLTVDDYQRIRLPDVKPRQIFAYEKEGPRITLTPVEPVRAPEVRLVRKNGHSYLVSELKFTSADVKRELEEFP